MTKIKKRNSSQFITRIASHPRKKEFVWGNKKHSQVRIIKLSFETIETNRDPEKLSNFELECGLLWWTLFVTQFIFSKHNTLLVFYSTWATCSHRLLIFNDVGEIGRQHIKASQAAGISPLAISCNPPSPCWRYICKERPLVPYSLRLVVGRRRGGGGL